MRAIDLLGQSIKDDIGNANIWKMSDDEIRTHFNRIPKFMDDVGIDGSNIYKESSIDDMRHELVEVCGNIKTHNNLSIIKSSSNSITLEEIFNRCKQYNYLDPKDVKHEVTSIPFMLLNKTSNDGTGVGTTPMNLLGAPTGTRTSKSLYPFSASPIKMIPEAERAILTASVGGKVLYETISRSTNREKSAREINAMLNSKGNRIPEIDMVDTSYSPILVDADKHIYESTGYSITFQSSKFDAMRKEHNKKLEEMWKNIAKWREEMEEREWLK